MAGCGGGERSPSVKALPLVGGSRVIVSQKVCDKGASPYCAVEMVVQDNAYPNGRALALAEKALLKRRKWRKLNAPVALEWSADSPGDKLRVTYAGAPGELQVIDLGWVKRTRRISLALSREIFAHRAAMSVELQLGTTA